MNKLDEKTSVTIRHTDHLIRQLTNAKDATMTGKNGKQKARDFAEVTTPLWLIDDQLDLLPKAEVLRLDSQVLDPCTGDGRYLMRYLWARIAAIKTVSDLRQAVSSLHGREIQSENVARARDNLYKVACAIADGLGFVPPDDLAQIIESNIRQEDFLADEILQRKNRTDRPSAHHG